MSDVIIFLALTLFSAAIARGFFTHPSWSDGDAVGVGIKWGSAISVVIFGVITVGMALHAVL